MKNILFVVFISMIFLFVCCNTTTNKNIIETEISDFDKILDSFQVNGSILIYDNDKNTFYSNDFDWATVIAAIALSLLIGTFCK